VYHSRVGLVLASASPRRAELLLAAGFTFEILPSDVDERRRDGELPEAMVRRLAEAKARGGASARPDAVVVGADTIVVLDDEVLGKPADDRDAARMLMRLSGREHVVLTGVSVWHRGRAVTAVERSVVRFSPLSASQVAWYVASGEPRDKAGAYAIQGLASRFVEAVLGSYTNVVGLPVARLCRLLEELRVETSQSPVPPD
jgi:septum formation protein